MVGLARITNCPYSFLNIVHPVTFACNKTTYHLYKKNRAEWRKGSVKEERRSWVPVMFAGDAVTHHTHKMLAFTISDFSAPVAEGAQGMRRAGTASLLSVGERSVLQTAGNYRGSSALGQASLLLCLSLSPCTPSCLVIFQLWSHTWSRIFKAVKTCLIFQLFYFLSNVLISFMCLFISLFLLCYSNAEL